MQIVKHTDLSFNHKQTILRLWNNEYPKSLTYDSMFKLEEYLTHLSQQSHYFLMIDEEIIGWAFTFERENEIWFAIIISEEFHFKGFGTLLLNKLKTNHSKLNGWVIDNANQLKSNGNFYQSPLDFYIKNDFTLIENIRLETDKISAVKINWSH